MIFPKLISLSSAEVPASALPEDPRHCCVPVDASIGPDLRSGDNFSFELVTPDYLANGPTRWGRGILIVPEFSWETVRSAVELQLRHAARPTWEGVAQELNKALRWEFDNYQPPKVWL